MSTVGPARSMPKMSDTVSGARSAYATERRPDLAGLRRRVHEDARGGACPRTAGGGSRTRSRSRSSSRRRASPQNSSGCSVSLARTTRPSAVTSSTAARLSRVRPNPRCSRPTPPPSVSPATPVWPTTPTGHTRPCACAAMSSSPRSEPPFECAVRAAGSTSTPRIADRSMTRPPSQLEWPAGLCPPDRTAISSPRSRPKRIAVATSVALPGRRIAAGRRSCTAFHSRRASS